jgi:hypothetical protein
MSQGGTNHDVAIAAALGQKKFIAKISFTATKGVTTITNFDDGTPVDTYALLCFQPSQGLPHRAHLRRLPGDGLHGRLSRHARAAAPAGGAVPQGGDGH